MNTHTYKFLDTKLTTLITKIQCQITQRRARSQPRCSSTGIQIITCTCWFDLTFVLLVFSPVEAVVLEEGWVAAGEPRLSSIELLNDTLSISSPMYMYMYMYVHGTLNQVDTTCTSHTQTCLNLYMHVYMYLV